MSNLLILAMYDEYRLLLPSLVLGVFLDILARRLDLRGAGEPDLKLGKLDAYGLVGAVIGLLFSVIYFGAMLLFGGIWWAIHAWTGAVVISVTVGYITGFVSGGGLRRVTVES